MGNHWYPERSILRPWRGRALASLLLLVGAAAAAQDLGFPTVTIEAVSDAFESGGRAGSFRVSRAGDLSKPLTVGYTCAGAAKNGIDYQWLSGTVTIPAGQDQALIVVAPIDDAEVEPDEEVSVRLLPDRAPFTVAVLPDTQGYTWAWPSLFTGQTRWIADRRLTDNIAFMVHEGDITENNLPEEWQRAQESLSWLDDRVPYALAVGNHDGLNGPQNQTAWFNRFFPLSSFQGRPNFGGVFESNRLDNSYHFFSAGGFDWLVLSLEFGPRNAVLDWANTVVTNHPDHKVIVVTHTHVYTDNTWIGSATNHFWAPTAYGRQNNGPDVWNKFLRHHANLVCVFSGHVLDFYDGMATGRLISFGDHGNRVYQMLANYQLYGQGLMRLVQFVPAEDKLVVRTYSPYLDLWFTDAENQFEYNGLGVFPIRAPTYTLGGADTATLLIHSDDRDLTPPDFRVVRATTQPAEITLQFDEPVDPLSALDPANYALSGEVAIAGARLAPDQRTVTLALGNELTSQQVYSLFVQNVCDLGAPPNPVPKGISRDLVYEPALLREDFSGLWRQDWTVVDEGTRMGPSSWETSLGRMLQCANIYGPNSDAITNRQGTFLYYARTAAFNWSNYVFSVVLHPLDNDGVGVMFRYQNPSNYYKLELDSERKFRRLYKKLDGVETVLATDLAGYTPNTDLPLEITASDGLLLATLNDLPLFNGPVADSDRPLLTGTVALYSWGCQGVAYSNVVVAPAEWMLRVSLQSPQPGQTFTFQPTITLTAEAFDPANRLVALQFLDETRLLGQVNRPPYTLVWSNAPSGNHVLRARGVQASGLTVTSESVPIQVAQPLEPAFLEPPQAQSAWLGGEALFYASVSGSPPVRFQWFYEGTPIPDATNAVLILRNLEPGQAGSYAVQVANPGGALASAPVLLSLGPAATTWEQDERQPRVDLVRVAATCPPVLRGMGPANTRLRLLVSDDLRQWTPLTTVTNAIGPFFHLDLEAAGHVQRWYRLEQTP